MRIGIEKDMPEEIEGSNFWEKRYQEGTTRWDLGQPAPPFVSLLNAPEAPPPGRAVVLGCGRGYEALLFADRGFDVVGVDFAPSAIAAATRNAQDASLNVRFLQRDIFELTPEFAGHFDYVIEHTCFCAIPPSKREAYIQLVRSLLHPNGELMGLFFTYDRPGGPPFGVTPAEIARYFVPDFEIVSLEPVTNSAPERQGEEHLGRFRHKGS